MKIGIIIHSHTGNTLAVAQRLKDKLIGAGHLVNLEQVSAVNEDPSAVGNIQLKTIPSIDSYDALIFGAPVRGFSLSPVMKAYLSQLSSLKDRKVGCFVTQHFPYSWMGGNNSIKGMKNICQQKGANVLESGIVNWSHKKRETIISEVLEKLMRLGYE
jgi:flavodoxin